jgi:hypothetical protein
MAIFSVIFTVVCIATRVYEEWDYQRKLVETQVQIEMALYETEMEAILGKMQLLSQKQAKGGSDVLTPAMYDETQKASTTLLLKKLDDFECCEKQLRSHVLLSYRSAALAGLRNGLYAYSAISSLMFAIAMITAISSISFPPFLVLAFGIAGMACLIGFLAHSLITNYQHLKANALEESRSRVNIHAILTQMKDVSSQVAEFKPKEIETAILDDNFDQSPQFWFQEWFEVLRSFFSGIGKGQKSIDYTLNPLLEPDDKGHYQDSPLMLWFTLASATIYTVVLTLRAHARGFGRPKITDTGADTPAPPPSPVVGSPPAITDSPPSPVADDSSSPSSAPLPPSGGVTARPQPESAAVLTQKLPAISFDRSAQLSTTQVSSAFTPVGRGSDRQQETAPLLVVADDDLRSKENEGDDQAAPLRSVGAGTLPRARFPSGTDSAALELRTRRSWLEFSLFSTSTSAHSLGGKQHIPRPASSGALPPPARGGLMRATSAGQLPSDRDTSSSPDGIVAGSR